jgi:hypothetical protein
MCPNLQNGACRRALTLKVAIAATLLRLIHRRCFGIGFPAECLGSAEELSQRHIGYPLAFPQADKRG